MRNLSSIKLEPLAITEHAIDRLRERYSSFYVSCKTIREMRYRLTKMLDSKNNGIYELDNGLKVVVEKKTIITLY